MDVRRRRLKWWYLGLVIVPLIGLGCTRASYHRAADRDSYGILQERLFDWRWRLPPRQVEADPRSRMADPADPDHEPIPRDDPGSRQFQVSSAFPFEYHGWKKRGMAPIEYLDWQKNIPTESDGSVLLSRDSIMTLALMNSRDYQFAYEDLYLAALNLTLARFQFMVQGFSRNGIFYQHLGAGKTKSDQLQLTTNDGFNLQLMSGAQILVDYANTLVFEYSGKGFHTVAPNLAINFVQPLLRGAWWRIVTQQLSLQERGVLYALRNFAHFRRQFYVGQVGGGGYLGLLTQLQAIRNQEQNLKSLKRNLDQYEEEQRQGSKSVLERDQIAQQYQAQQLSLLSSQAGLQTQLDSFKIGMGLPPEMSVRLDDKVLQQFQLNDLKLDDLRTRNDALALSLQQTETLPRQELDAAAKSLLTAYQELEKVHTEALNELRQWQTRLEEERKQGFEGPDAEEHQALFDRKAKLAGQIDAVLKETDQTIDGNIDEVTTYIAQLGKAPPEEELVKLRELSRKSFRARLSEIFVAQTQVRVFLIELQQIDLTVDQAIQIALANRLDLKNALAQVTDAWRNLEVEANALKGFLNFSYSGNLAAAPGHTTLFRFDASASSHRFGLQFDAPINRRAERNAYRAGQIQYQRARRAYMLLRDTIVQQIRLDMRQLLLSRKQFDINREQLITTSRQLEQAEYALQGPSEGQPVTLNLIQALQSVLTARNTLIGTWVSYESNRLNLFRDFDLMDIDANGVWTNERDPRLLPNALQLAAAAPAFSLAIPAGVPDLSRNEPGDSAFYSDVKPGDRIIPDEAEGTEGPLSAPDLRREFPFNRPAPGGRPPVAPPSTPSPFAQPPRP